MAAITYPEGILNETSSVVVPTPGGVILMTFSGGGSGSGNQSMLILFAG